MTRQLNPNLQTFVTHTPEGQRIADAFHQVFEVDFAKVEERASKVWGTEGSPRLTFQILGGLPPLLLITGSSSQMLEAAEILDGLQVTYEPRGRLMLEVSNVVGLKPIPDPIAALDAVVQYLKKHL